MTTSRRAVLLLGAAGMLTGCGPEDATGSGSTSTGATATAGATPALVDQTHIEIAFTGLEQRCQARLGVSAVDLDNGRRLAWRADERFALGSTYKAYAAGALLQLVDQSRKALATKIPIERADLVDHAPVTTQHTGGTMTLAELCAAALEQSDNTAANLILGQIGGPAGVTTFARSLGDTTTRLDRTEPSLNQATPGDQRDTTTPGGLATGLQALLTAGPLSDRSRNQLLEWMKQTQTSGQRFRAALPKGWTSADRTGTASYGTTNDAGLLIGPHSTRIALAVLSDTTTGNAEAKATDAVIALATAEAIVQFTGQTR